MTINARAKGKAGEQEVISILQPILTDIFGEFGFVAPTLRRNAQQYADGGEDIANLPWYSIEVKRCEKSDLARWWLQAAKQAERTEVRVGDFALVKPYNGYKNPQRMAAWWDRDLVASGIGALVGGKPTILSGIEVPEGAPSESRPKDRDMSEQRESEKRGRMGGFQKKIPVLFWRKNRCQWRVLVPLMVQTGGSGLTTAVNMTIPAEISLDAFASWWRFDLRGHIGAYCSICEGLRLRRLA